MYNYGDLGIYQINIKYKKVNKLQWLMHLIYMWNMQNVEPMHYSDDPRQLLNKICLRQSRQSSNIWGPPIYVARMYMSSVNILTSWYMSGQDHTKKQALKQVHLLLFRILLQTHLSVQ